MANLKVLDGDAAAKYLSTDGAGTDADPHVSHHILDANTDGVYIGNIKFGESLLLAANSGVDIGDVTINNASGASAVNIQDGGNTITVDGSVTVSATDLDIRNLLQSQDSVLIYGSDDGGTTKRVIKTDSGGAIQVDLEVASVAITSFPDNEPFNLSQYGGTAAGAGNAIHVQPGTSAVWDVSDRAARLVGQVYGSQSAVLQQKVTTNDLIVTLDGETVSVDLGANNDVTVTSGNITSDTELTTADFDLGAGTDTRAVVGLVGSKDGGGEIVPGDATNGLLVNLGANNDVTVTGSVTANAGTNLNTSALATSAKQLADGHNVTIDNLISNEVYVRGSGTAGSADAAVLTVQGIASGTALAVTESSPISGFATSAKQLADGHNVTVDNAAGAAAVNIQDGGNTITVDGSVTADTELPAAGALGDAMANPTTPLVGATLLGWDVSNTCWERLKTDESGILQVKAAANAGVDIGDVTINNAANAGVYVREGTSASWNIRALTNADTVSVEQSTAASLNCTEASAASILTAVQLIDNPVAVLGTAAYAEATTSAFVIGAVRNDTLATLVNTDNEIAPLQVDASGALYVNLSGEGIDMDIEGVAAENASAAGNPVLVGGRYDVTPRTLGDTDVGAIALDADGAVHIADGGNSITVDGTFWQTTQPVSGTFWQATQPVSGTVTANLSATDNAVLDQIELNTDPLLVVGGGTEATAIRITIANDSTGLLSVDDNAGSLTIDNAALSVVGGGAEATALRVTIANDSTGVLTVDDGGSSLTIDGSVAADTELAAAAALSDTFGNPTTATVGAMNMVWDDANSHWERLIGVEGLSDSDAGDAVTLKSYNNDETGLMPMVALGYDNTTNDNAYRALAVTANGALEIADGGNTITVDGTVTANLSAADNAVLDQIELNTDPLLVVGGGAEATAIRITVANDSTGVLSIDDNAGSITVDGTFWQATQPVSGTVTANLSATDNAVLDQIELNTDPLLVVGGGAEATAIRVTIANDSTGVLSIDDNAGAITVDNAGTFAVQVNGNALTALQLIDDIVYADDADWTDGTSKHALVGGLYQSSPQSITDGDVGPFQVTANGYLITSVNGAVTVDANSSNVTVDNAAGASAVNIQDGGNTITVDGTVTANLSATDNAVLDQIELNTDPLLVVGGGTEAAAIRVTIANDSTGVLTVDDGGGALTVDGTVTATPSGIQEIEGDEAEGSGNLPQPVLIGGDDGTDVKNINVDATTGDVQVDVTNQVDAGGATPVVTPATGSAAIATSYAPSADFWLESITLHLSAAGTTSENFTATLNATDGAAYDTILLSQDLSKGAVTDLVWVPEGGPMLFENGDAIDVAWANTETRTYGLRIISRLA